MPKLRSTIENDAKLARAPLAPSPTPRVSTPAVTKVEVARKEINWAKYNNDLVARGNVFTLVFDTLSLSEWKPKTGKRGQPAYSAAVINICYQLRATLHLTLRATEGFLVGLFEREGLGSSLVPDFSTLCKRRGDVTLARIKLTPGGAWLIDGTGISYHAKGYWASKKYGRGDRRFVRVTLTTDAATGIITGISVTRERGEGTGEPTQVPTIFAASPVLPAVLIGDGAYDTRAVYETCRQHDIRLITPPKITAIQGLHPDRDVTIRQVGRLGMKTWKQRTGYHVRSLVESTNGALKQTLGDTTKAHTFEGARADVLARTNVYNRWLVQAA